MRFVAFMLAGGLAGCSSVPDVTFADVDASMDAAVVAEAGPGPGPSGYSCPDRPPPAKEGICCGKHVCIGCTFLQCDRCERADCDDDEVCCARGPGLGGGNVSCNAAAKECK